jgi:hypothetical protein
MVPMIHCFGKRVTISRYVTVTIRQRQQGKVDMGETEMKKFDDRTYTITNMDVVKPLPVEYPYCALCLNFSWELVERVWWKDIGGKPISCYNRYIPQTGERLCYMRTLARRCIKGVMHVMTVGVSFSVEL